MFLLFRKLLGSAAAIQKRLREKVLWMRIAVKI